MYGGRWNSEGNALLYTASNVSLATLEVMTGWVRLNKIIDYSLVTIHLPDVVFETRKKIETMEDGWIQNQLTTRLIGDSWIKKNNEAILEVPSAIVPVDKNILINLLHSDFKKIKILDIYDYNFDNRLVR